ncbi:MULTISPECIES: EAL domain-containing response regulator [Pseudomonas]|uniref:EAL domain-containing protein n=2 Tax=Pseudomonas proteolytica TaxID=219574 RepID=A0AAW5A326_9PSED|nr:MULTISPECIES: EAL domain-containing response regulator [Pseudomonas]KAA8701505.1 EAL domain-containing protein [Pseudomonas proteolytica]MCF5058297.1 EAL domain-containing protein [Pseudomonas proteolytica]OHW40137.1 diguanylate phosphodiesterase [Pseudomonas sp. 06C 126]TWR74939.1 EAL domain-containing protein [Pseudomonas proteolytica]SEE24318.1 EAL domain, c-di-GMP-specific phosphodiesterase class I (or its enzymatically inactive variant) [Pseudomonas proteolytica]
MMSLRVLVLDAQLSSRKLKVASLGALGTRAVYQASHCDKAMAILRQVDGVDIVVCELNNDTLARFDFLLAAARDGLVSAVVLCSALAPQLHRALERINLFARISLAGVVGPDAPVQQWHLILTHYIRRKTMSHTLPAILFKLPTEYEVRQGLAAGQFNAWFQPKFDLRREALCGVEALVRWEHPSRGVLLPRDFLSAVLAYDLIDDMFKQVFSQGLDLLDALGQGGRHLEVAFNLHASQLASFDLPSYVEAALIERKLPGSAVSFEIAQNGLLDMSLATMASLLRLKGLGCGLSIDDFGVGFSSLTLLCQLPFNQLKLDASLVEELSDENSRAMLATSVALSRAVGMSLMVEGVSSQAIQDTVIAMGGTFAQGFHLAKPMTAKRLLHWLGSTAPAVE